jgi:hypothetical protein
VSQDSVTDINGWYRYPRSSGGHGPIANQRQHQRGEHGDNHHPVSVRTRKGAW